MPHILSPTAGLKIKVGILAALARYARENVEVFDILIIRFIRVEGVDVNADKTAFR